MREFGLQIVEELELGRHGNAGQRVVAGVGGDVRALGIENGRDHIPGAERRDVALEGRAVLEPFEDGDVGIWNFVVAVDAGIVGETAESFVVAGI